MRNHWTASTSFFCTPSPSSYIKHVNGKHRFYDLIAGPVLEELGKSVVGPTGVFCIETKTRSKPVKGSSTVQYDGEKVTVDGFAPDRDPIVQAKASARWLQELLESSTGKKFAVQSVVLFPGWYVEKMPEKADVWVLNEKALPIFMQNAKTDIAPDDVSLITFHLKRFVISHNPNTDAR